MHSRRYLASNTFTTGFTWFFEFFRILLQTSTFRVFGFRDIKSFRKRNFGKKKKSEKVLLSIICNFIAIYLSRSWFLLIFLIFCIMWFIISTLLSVSVYDAVFTMSLLFSAMFEGCCSYRRSFYIIQNTFRKLCFWNHSFRIYLMDEMTLKRVIFHQFSCWTHSYTHFVFFFHLIRWGFSSF